MFEWEVAILSEQLGACKEPTTCLTFISNAVKAKQQVRAAYQEMTQSANTTFLHNQIVKRKTAYIYYTINFKRHNQQVRKNSV